MRAVVTHFGGGHAPVARRPSPGDSSCAAAASCSTARYIPLSRTGVDLLAALFDAAGGVVSRARLQSALPRSGENTHAIEMAVARVREALGAPELIKTVVKRGYRLDVIDPADALGLTSAPHASRSGRFSRVRSRLCSRRHAAIAP